MRYGFPTMLGVVMGIIIIVAVLEICRKSLGIAIPILAIIFILYGLFGHYLPGIIRSYQNDWDIFFYQVSLEGVYGSMLAISADYIFLFVVFGGGLQAAGISRLFREVGILVGRSIKSGPAMVAVVGSSLIGSVTMSPSANTAICGSYTIPLMKKSGYKPHQAAAIEAAASTGGQIMPPVMSSVAFIMASITGIPYARIAAAGLIPAILFYVSIGGYAHLQALKMGVKPLPGDVNWRELALESRLFLVPIVIIVVLLIMRFTPMYTIFWAIIASVVMGLIRPSTRPSLKQWIDGFTDGAVLGANVGISLAAIGIVVKVITMTGLATRLPGVVEAVSGGNIYVLLALIAFVTLFLGCGIPTPAAYIIVAMTTAPVLVQVFGLSPLQSHYFVFYFAVMAFVTPPVAQAAFVAAALAGTTYMKVAVEDLKPAIAGFLVPIAFVWIPLVLGSPNNLLIEIPMLICFSWSLVLIQAVFVGYFWKNTTLPERILCGVIGAAIIVGIILGSLPAAVAFSLAGGGLAFYQSRRKAIALEAEPQKIQ